MTDGVSIIECNAQVIRWEQRRMGIPSIVTHNSVVKRYFRKRDPERPPIG